MKRFFGFLLLAVGVLIAGAAGLCTVGAMQAFLGAGMNGSGETTAFAILTPLLFGLIPMAAGAGFVVWGWLLLRKRK